MDENERLYSFKKADEIGRFKLSSLKLFEICADLEQKLHDNGVCLRTSLIIPLPDEDFYKIDEDLFYRNKVGEEKYIPSDKEIIINFIYLTIKIVKEKTKK